MKIKDLEIGWQKEPESTTNKTDDGYLHFAGYINRVKRFEIRFNWNGLDVWTLTDLHTKQQWTREGRNKDQVCKRIAYGILRHEQQENLNLMEEI
jgi:hypothetical protein